jgi:hypothetical protein
MWINWARMVDLAWDIEAGAPVGQVRLKAVAAQTIQAAVR